MSDPLKPTLRLAFLPRLGAKQLVNKIRQQGDTPALVERLRGQLEGVKAAIEAHNDPELPSRALPPGSRDLMDDIEPKAIVAVGVLLEESKKPLVEMNATRLMTSVDSLRPYFDPKRKDMRLTSAIFDADLSAGTWNSMCVLVKLLKKDFKIDVPDAYPVPRSQRGGAEL